MKRSRHRADIDPILAIKRECLIVQDEKKGSIDSSIQSTYRPRHAGPARGNSTQLVQAVQHFKLQGFKGGHDLVYGQQRYLATCLLVFRFSDEMLFISEMI